MKKRKKSIIMQAITEITILIIGVFAFAFLLSPQVSAEEVKYNVCCEKTKSGAWCQNTLEENCNTNYLITPTSCESTSFCSPGCCFDSSEGFCMENTPENVCNQQEEGTWINSPECNVKQCELGCCILGTQASFVTLTRCKSLSAQYGLETDFKKDITDEISCLAYAASQDKGACVFEFETDLGSERRCIFTTRGKCSENENSEFYRDYLCSAEELATNCGMTKETMCVEGKEEVYFKDTCGNPANIYDASRAEDASYWKEVVGKADSCYDNSATGNADSKTCGNCNYFKGSICSEGDATYGDFACKDLNCYNTQNGNNYKNGESWCVFQSATGQGRDAVGSRHYRHVCINGEEIVEPCDDFRMKVCLESQTNVDGYNFNEAACRANRGFDCLKQDEEDDCLNTDKRDCFWLEGARFTGSVDEVNLGPTSSGSPVFGNANTGGFTGSAIAPITGFATSEDSSSISLGGSICLPQVPPGLRFWDSGSSKNACSKGNSVCVVEYEKKLISGKKCKDNCECLEEEYTQKMNEVCTALGDCGAYVNIAGRFTNKGYSVTGAPKLSDSIASSMISKARAAPITGKAIELADAASGGFITKFFKKLGLATGIGLVSGEILEGKLSDYSMTSDGTPYVMLEDGRMYEIYEPDFYNLDALDFLGNDLRGSDIAQLKIESPGLLNEGTETQQPPPPEKPTIDGGKPAAGMTAISSEVFNPDFAKGPTRTVTIDGKAYTFNQHRKNADGTFQLLENGKEIGTSQTKERLAELGYDVSLAHGGYMTTGKFELALVEDNFLTGKKYVETWGIAGRENEYVTKDGDIYKKPEKSGEEWTKTSSAGGKPDSKKTSGNLVQDLQNFAIGAGMGALIGSWIGDNADMAMALAMGVASWIWGAEKGTLGAKIGEFFGFENQQLGGLVVGAIIFLLMYKKESTETIEFTCEPYEPPVGGRDCELCNEFEECTEYTCKSLGQACGLVNSEDEKRKMCVWKNPHDTKSPGISPWEEPLTKGLSYEDVRIRPAGSGVEPGRMRIVNKSSDDGCIEAFTPLEFGILTTDSNGAREPAQCKIDYNITTKFEDMTFYMGNSNLFSYNHTEKLSLPGPANIKSEAPELENDGKFTLYLRCQDANGNVNDDSFAVQFCVKEGPDTTPPRIVDVSIPSKSPIRFNKTTLENLKFYINEPAECRWSRENKDYSLMENEMECNTDLTDVERRNNDYVYACKTTLTGIEDRKENEYFVRCKDQPALGDSTDRNANMQSYRYVVIGTQPLNILEYGPNGTIYGATDTIPVFLTVETDNGYKNGEAFCYYSETGSEDDYIMFRNTSTLSEFTNKHSQRLDLPTGDYIYFFKCIDLGNNVVYVNTSFRVETDRQGPIVVRAYKEGTSLKIITNEESDCSYSSIDCNFEISDGINMPYDGEEEHKADWEIKKYHIRCRDKYNNQPDPNTCSIIVKPYEVLSSLGYIEL